MRLTLVFSVVLVAAALQPSPPRPQPRPILIIGGTIVDPAAGAPRHNDGVPLAEGRIRTVGPQAVKRAPKNARTIEASGKWILPGLIDGHVHFFQTGGLDARPDFIPHPAGRPYVEVVDDIRRMPQPYLRAYVCSGVTSVVDFGGPSWIFDLRHSREDDPLAPRIAFAGPLLATADPPQLELENDEPIWLMNDESRTRALIDRLGTRRPDFIKIWFVHRMGDDLQAQAALVGAAIGGIHGKKLRAAVHATSLDTARLAVNAGADVLVHSVGDREVDEEFVRRVVERGVIYVPTLMVGRSYREVAARNIRFEPFERECAPAHTIESFSALGRADDSRAEAPPRPDQLPVQQKNLQRLWSAGAIVAAGTDAGNTRTLHGPSLHREFVLMAEAGLKPLDILKSATVNGARLIGRERELGRIEEGAAADLLLLDADPLADIQNTRRISSVIKGGSVYER